MGFRACQFDKLLVSFIIFFCTGILAQGTQLPLLSNLNSYSIGYNDCWGYTAPDDREYALLGVLNGTSIIDLSQPTNIQEVAFVSSVFSIWKDIKTYQSYAYVVTESENTLQILDLSDLPNQVTEVVNIPIFNSNPHNISIDTENGILYGAEDNQFGQSVHVISLADPENPVSITTFGTDCHDMVIQDDILYVAEGVNGTIGIFDMQTPSAPQLLARVNIPNPGYVHNVWPSEDGTLMVTTEETVGKTVKLWDISDYNNIELLSEYLSADGLAHNAHFQGDYIYLSHYRDGLRILDTSNPNVLQEVAFYDTYNGNGGVGEGNWGAFPHFSSNLVLASDQSNGLFVFRFPISGSPGDPDLPLPQSFSLGDNYPNPFNPTTTIPFEVSQNSRVTISVYNVLGQKIATLVNDVFTPGSYFTAWNGLNFSGNPVSSGIYFYGLIIDGKLMAGKKMNFNR